MERPYIKLPLINYATAKYLVDEYEISYRGLSPFWTKICRKLVRFLTNKGVLKQKSEITRDMSVKMITIPESALRNELINTIMNLEYSGKKIDLLIVGQDVMQRLIEDFDTQRSFDPRYANMPAFQWRGYTIRLIPWFEGILPLSREELLDR